jgi:protocatechuate 3,4-dioxygenase beta subunit
MFQITKIAVRRFPVFLIALPLLLTLNADAVSRTDPTCRPTQRDALGPFYEPNAPVRDSVGSGYRLSGSVRAAGTCDPIAGAKIELWLAGPDGNYGDAYRATVFSDNSGRYRFESHFPPAYFGRPPHIHIKVGAGGFQTLITQHYPKMGDKKGMFDLVLRPA